MTTSKFPRDSIPPIFSSETNQFYFSRLCALSVKINILYKDLICKHGFEIHCVIMAFPSSACSGLGSHQLAVIASRAANEVISAIMSV